MSVLLQAKELAADAGHAEDVGEAQPGEGAGREGLGITGGPPCSAMSASIARRSAASSATSGIKAVPLRWRRRFGIFLPEAEPWKPGVETWPRIPSRSCGAISSRFGNRDGESRRRAIGELFTEDCVFSDPHGRQVGQDALDRTVIALHEATPSLVFREMGEAQAIPDAGRLSWGYGPAGQPPVVTGQDLVVFREGRIAALYTFLDQPGA